MRTKSLIYGISFQVTYNDIFTYIIKKCPVDTYNIGEVALLMVLPNISKCEMAKENKEHCKNICDYIQKNIVNYIVREFLGCDVNDINIECDCIYTDPFNCFFPNEIGMSRQVSCKIWFNDITQRNRLKLKNPKAYNCIVERNFAYV